MQADPDTRTILAVVIGTAGVAALIVGFFLASPRVLVCKAGPPTGPLSSYVYETVDGLEIEGGRAVPGSRATLLTYGVHAAIRVETVLAPEGVLVLSGDRNGALSAARLQLGPGRVPTALRIVSRACPPEPMAGGYLCFGATGVADFTYPLTCRPHLNRVLLAEQRIHRSMTWVRRVARELWSLRRFLGP